MWREIANALKELLLLREHTKRNADDIQEMQKDFKALTAFVERLAYEARKHGATPAKRDAEVRAASAAAALD